MHIALATAAHLPQGSEDDQVLIHALRSAGIETSIVIWDQPAHWNRFDAVVLRSIWDYHLKYARFLEWLDLLDASGARVFNSTDVVRWNADKHYMLDLAERGVPITPTRIVKAGADVALRRILREEHWHRAVIKPTVSSTGHETWFVNGMVTDKDEARFAAQRATMDVMVQEFADGVRAGEMSFVFLGGTYSHAVLKRAADSEFRIHVEHGGSVETYWPTEAETQWAQSVMDAVHEPWTYARVDAVRHADSLVLMELELLDPELFFKYRPAAAGQLIGAVGISA